MLRSLPVKRLRRCCSRETDACWDEHKGPFASSPTDGYVTVADIADIADLSVATLAVTNPNHSSYWFIQLTTYR
ncbi:hypothetical protein SAE02_25510 [Skermanella aerolata]|uniref:Uncharacterized protein n=1 Tax=Skermanella aerolata TaxID=393310 RepID=A0A512DPK0_9PROT|nr:hypothetical protein SAE02_25510 [Skermanella aerolata]